MRGMIRTAIVSLLLVPGFATAAPQFDVEARLEVSGTMAFAGQANLTGQSQGLYYTGIEDDPVRVSLEAQNARLRVVNAPFLAYGGLGFPVGNRSRPLSSEVLRDEPFSGTIELTRTFANATHHFMPRVAGDPIAFSLEGPRQFRIDPPLKGERQPRSDLNDNDPNIQHALFPPSTIARLVNPEGFALRLEKDLFVMFLGGQVVLQGLNGQREEVWTGKRVNASRSVADPTHSAGAWWVDQIVLIVSGFHVSARIEDTRAGQLHSSLTRLGGTWEGDLTFAGVSGHVDVNGKNLTPEPILFQTIGRFDGSAAYEGGKGTWAFEGPATFVGINGLTVVGDRLAHLQQSIWTVVGGVTALGLLLAALTPAGRAFLGGILGRNEAQPLGHPTRRQFMQSIAKNPGISRAQLQAQSGVHKSTARHHLRLLRRAGLIDVVAGSGKECFTLNEASYRFPLEPLAGPPQKPQAKGALATPVLAAHALAALNGPVRRLIHQALEHVGPCSYDDMTKAWRDMQAPPPWPSRSQVSRHATALLRAGLLERRRTGKRIRWALAVDLAGVRSKAMERLLSNAKNRLVFDLATQQPKLSRDEIVRRFAQRFPARPVSKVDEILLKLEYAGLLPGAGPADAAISRPVPNPAAASPG